MVIIVEGDILLISFTAFAIQTLNGGCLLYTSDAADES